ncbi:MAG: hypothetical protein ACTSQY_03300 [Candidatus Odinarchaeia archaeon]
MVYKTNPNLPGVPKTEAQRIETHKAIYGNENLPPRGSGTIPKEGDNIPRKDVLKYFDTGQVDLTATTATYKIVTLRGGQSVIIEAMGGNSGYVYIGKKDVTSSTGFQLAAGASIKIEYLPDKETNEYLDLYAIPATAGDDVCFIIVP